MLARKPFARTARRFGLFVERLEDRVNPTRSVSPTEVLAGLLEIAGPAQETRSTPLKGFDVTPLGGGIVSIATNGLDPNALVSQLQAIPGVAWAQPNFVYNIATETDYIPNDTEYAGQTSLAAMNVPAAWNELLVSGKTLGNSGTVVAVFDEGIAVSPSTAFPSHNDLQNGPGSLTGIARNTAELNNSIDDDGNGFIDDISGWDFTNFTEMTAGKNGDNDPSPNAGANHGHEVAGVIAARTNNLGNIGDSSAIAGIAGGQYFSGTTKDQVGGVRILPIRVISGSTITSAGFAAALNYTASRFVRIANMSFDTDQFAADSAVQSGMTALYDSGCLIIASAGNTGAKDAARGAFDQVLFVAGTTNDGKIAKLSADPLSYSSNYGQYVDIAAPSYGIVTLGDPGSTIITSGTSLAAPAVAGTAALLLAQNPSYTRDQLAAKLLGTAVNIDALNPGYEGQLGAGRVDALNALTSPLAAPTITDFKINGVSVADGGTVSGISTITLTVKGVLNPASVTAGAFELRSDGPDNVFGNFDDSVLSLAISKPYRLGEGTIILNASGTMNNDHYRFGIATGSSSLRDPFDGVIQTGANLSRNIDLATEKFARDTVETSAFNITNAATTRNAIYPDGSFVLTWQADQLDGNGPDIYVKVMNADGSVKTSDFKAGQYYQNTQSDPNVAVLTNGNFVVTWASNGQDGNQNGVYARMFDSSGTAIANEFLVNTGLVGDETDERIAALSTGGFVIVFRHGNGQEIDIYSRRYAANGSPIDANPVVIDNSAGNQNGPRVAADNSGGYLVTWSGSSERIYSQRFDATNKGGNIVQVNQESSYLRYCESVAIGPDGSFVATWITYSIAAVNKYTVFARHFSATSTPLGNEFIVGTNIATHQYNPKVGFYPNGDYEIIWENESGDGSGSGIYSQKYSANDSKIGTETRLNTIISGNQQYPSMSSNGRGQAVVSWTSAHTSPTSIQFLKTELSTTPKLLTLRPDNDTNIISPNERVVQSVSAIVAGINLPLKPSGSNSPISIANWQLTIDGIDKTSLLSNISHTFNPANGLFETTLQLSQPILTGNVTLRAKDSIQDTNGNALDGDADGIFGGDFVRSFTVANIGLRGTQSRVNTTTAGSQAASDVAMAADGRSVTVWQGAGVGDSDGVFAQIFDNKGVAVGGEIRVNAATAGAQGSPRVAMDAAGNFTVAWVTNTGAGENTTFYRQFTAAGVAVQGADQAASTAAPGTQQGVDIAMTASGQFVLAWQEYANDLNGNIFARRFNAAGAALDANPVLVHTITVSGQSGVALAMDAAGNFVAAWTDKGVEGDLGVQARLFRADGTAVGDQFSVNTAIAGDQSRPAAAMDAAGSFVVAWQSNVVDSNIKLRFFNSAGVPTTAELAGTTSTVLETAPGVAMDADGDTTLVWQAANAGTGNDIVFSRYNSAGAVTGTPIVVGSDPTGSQVEPAIVLDATGNGAIAWFGAGSDDADGVFRQRLAGNDALTTTGIPTQNTTEDGSINYFLPGTFSDPNNPTPSFTYSIVGSTAAPGFFKTLSIINDFVFAEPATNATGSAIITVRATIPGGLYADASFALIVQPVNDPPTFVKGGNLVTVINSVPQTVPNWATGISGGPGESDAVTFEIVSNSNPSLFSTPPAITDKGTLTYAPAVGEYGAAVIQVRARDNGGTANGGIDASATQTFVITVDPTNPANRQFGTDTKLTLTGDQTGADVAVNALGTRVVTWVHTNGGDSDVFAQVYEANGAAVGVPFQVNKEAALNQYSPSVGIAADGSFVIAWASDTASVNSELRLRTFNPYGVPISGDLPVHGVRSDIQASPQVAMRPDGQFVVVWDSGPTDYNVSTSSQDGTGFGVFARSFTAAGVPVSDEISVNTTLANHQYVSSVGMAADGSFVVSWMERLSNSSQNLAVLARRFNADVTPKDPTEITVQASSFAVSGARVAADADGDFAVVYTMAVLGNPEVHLRRYTSGGTAIGAPAVVFPHAATNIDESYGPDVAMDADGDIVVTAITDKYGESFQWRGMMQRFDRNGAFVGGAVRVTPSGPTMSLNDTLRAAVDADGDAFMSWNSLTGPDQDVHVRRHGSPEPTSNTSAAVINDADGNLDLGTFFTNNSGPQEALGFTLGGNGANNLALSKKSLSGRTLTYEFGPGIYGSAEVLVRVADTTEGTNGVGLITVRKLHDANASPILDFIRDRSINEGGTLSLTASAVDKQGANNLVYTLLNASPGSLDASKGTLTWTPSDSGTQAITVRVTDPDNTYYTQETFTVNVANVAPTAALGGPTVVAPNGTPQFTFTGQSDIPADLPTLRYAFDYNNDGVWEVGGIANDTKSVNWASAATTATVTAPGTFFGTAGTTRTVRGRVIDKDGGFTDYFRSVNIENVGGALTPPAATVKVNDGTAQRSNVTKLTVAFDQAVTFPNGLAVAFTLTRAGSGAVPFAVSFANNVATITFVPGAFTATSTAEPSLIDGQYTLTVIAANVQGLAGPMMANSVTNFKRFFGDGNGDATVDAGDFAMIGNALGFSIGHANYSPALDVNADGTIDATDLAQFGNRFGLTL